MDKDKIYSALRRKQDQLIVTHDLSLTNFKRVVNNGAMSYPSLAVHQMRSLDFDYPDLGFAGSSDFGSIRLVIDSSKLLANPYTFKSEVHAFDSDIFSTMVPTVRYSLSEEAMFDVFANRIGDSEHLEVLMQDLMDSISEDVFEDGYTIYADFHSEVVRTKAMKFLFSRDIAKDGVSGLRNSSDLMSALEQKLYHFSDPRYDDFIHGLLVDASHEQGMCVADEYVAFKNGVTENDVIDAIFEEYPVYKKGTLLKQCLDAGVKGVDSLSRELVGVIFSRKFADLCSLDANRTKLMNTASFLPHSTNKSNYTSAINKLYLVLSDMPIHLVNDALLLCMREENSCGVLDANQILNLFSDAGLIVDEELRGCVESCVRLKEQDLQPYFEIKLDNRLPLDAISHIVAPQILSEEISALVDGLGIKVNYYAEESTILDSKWQRLVATFDEVKDDFYLLDRGGNTFSANKDIAEMEKKLKL